MESETNTTGVLPVEGYGCKDMKINTLITELQRIAAGNGNVAVELESAPRIVHETLWIVPEWCTVKGQVKQELVVFLRSWPY